MRFFQTRIYYLFSLKLGRVFLHAHYLNTHSNHGKAFLPLRNYFLEMAEPLEPLIIKKKKNMGRNGETLEKKKTRNIQIFKLQ